MYHRFSDEAKPGFCSREAFERQLDYIHRHFQPLTLVDLVQCIECHRSPPPNAIVVTIDDGYRDFFEVARPLLRRYEVPATVFVATGFIAGRLWLWPDQISWLLTNATRWPEELMVGSFPIANNSHGVWSKVVDALLATPDSQRAYQIESIAEQLGTTLPVKAPEQYEAMDWSQLQQLQSEGFEIGGHTVNHPTLGQVTKEQAWTEINGTWDELSTNLGSAPRTFCYPNGQPSDYQDFLPELVARAGFTGAVTAFPDALGVRDRFAMRRHSAGQNAFQFMKAVSGVEYLGHRLKRNVRLPLSTHLN